MVRLALRPEAGGDAHRLRQGDRSGEAEADRRRDPGAELRGSGHARQFRDLLLAGCLSRERVGHDSVAGAVLLEHVEELMLMPRASPSHPARGIRSGDRLMTKLRFRLLAVMLSLAICSPAVPADTELGRASGRERRGASV